MEFSSATLEHLRDEAYASLCREVLQAQLASLEREKEQIADSRPPFGLLARRGIRDAFTRSMRTALDNEVALRERLARLDGILDWLRPLIRNGVSAYLAGISQPYCALLQVEARLDDWECAVQALPDLLLAFARDVHSVRVAASPAGAAAPAYARELAALRTIVGRLERHRHELDVIAQAIGELTAGGLAVEVRLPALPDIRRSAWLGRLALLSPAQVVAEATRVEAEARRFLADESLAAGVAARLQASRDLCANLAENALEQYWNQLRTHARAHYVEERDVDEVLDMLTRRYVDAGIKSRLDEPFAVAN